MTEERLDLLLVGRRLARSRSAAAALVADGGVRVAGRVQTRPGTRVATDATIEVDGGAGWVGRGAVKLEAAIAAFAVEVEGALALDLGASTGGFTQVLLRRGASRVIALDVGHGQLAPEIRDDARVIVLEGVNARALDAAELARLAGIAAAPRVVVADLSFISLALVLPAIAAVAAPTADVIVLVKPQFEVGRHAVRGGVVRDPADRAAAVLDVLVAAAASGLGTAGVIASPIAGAGGNREVLVHLRPDLASDPAEWQRTVERVARGGDGEAG